MPYDEHADDAAAAAGESRYLLLVGGLLVIIIMSLGWLWLSERSRRIAAERQAAEVQLELDLLREQEDLLKRMGARIVMPPLASRPSATAPSGRDK